MLRDTAYQYRTSSRALEVAPCQYRRHCNNLHLENGLTGCITIAARQNQSSIPYCTLSILLGRKHSACSGPVLRSLQPVSSPVGGVKGAV